MCPDAVPGLMERIAMINSSTERVQLELEKIDELSSVDEKVSAITAYAKGLAETRFSALFMVILSGELNKRWITLAEELVPVAESSASNCSSQI